ncbi:glycosyl hydrolase family 18 protein [Pseudoalteromonas sp. T1lg65]|uniref:glycosyl hydrolase family 18 protein n=1 Tax=Pseudoalteromonas sp. T1lg65 TaxID=2077101 RepID=UPI003F7AF4E0
MKFTTTLLAVIPLVTAVHPVLAADCTGLPTWSSSQVYIGGNLVKHLAKRYEAKWWNQNQDPSANSGPWDVWRYLDDCEPVQPKPEVKITTPNAGARLVLGSSVTLSAEASHPQGVQIERVEFYMDNVLVATDQTSPYTYLWQAQGLGQHTLNAKAIDASDMMSESSEVSFSVVTDDPIPDDGFKIVGYFPSWQGSVDDIQFDKLTHINYSFLLPNADGTLKPLENLDKMTALVTAAHGQGVKVGIAIGGWNGGDDSAFETFANSAQGRTRFVQEVMAFVVRHNLDGVDMDWEYPDPGASAENYALLMKELGQALHQENKFLTAAVVALGYTGGGVLESVFDDIDFLNLMAYDANNANHASMQYAKDSIAYWQARGLAKEKTVLGVPFYARPTWKAYKTLLQENSANACRDTDGSSYYNGIPTIRAKTEYAKLNAGGIMNWELSHDSNGPASLLTAKWEVAKGLSPSYNCQ